MQGTLDLLIVDPLAIFGENGGGGGIIPRFAHDLSEWLRRSSQVFVSQPCLVVEPRFEPTDPLTIFGENGGGGGIRTHGTLRHASFQD